MGLIVEEGGFLVEDECLVVDSEDGVLVGRDFVVVGVAVERDLVVVVGGDSVVVDGRVVTDDLGVVVVGGDSPVIKFLMARS